MTTVHLFQRVPEVLEYYQKKFQYIHVDEYQDTNRAQYLLVRMLADRFKTSASLVTPTSRSMDGAVRIFTTSFLSSKIIRTLK
ncbi:ATP-dependent DNA helicase UvrD/PcrA [Sporolactobacillus inulinus]|uniref:ATP-dependent DNA helicase UvrD/PcrA n=1 Tax=Sporolactobacillus inulinus TaxID=2078 RepID=A0A4Y1ZF02_9BACL|nr:ATP-dependent DNA helicase UvrD/PcrA [Sporolactobacillus inulinus]